MKKIWIIWWWASWIMLSASLIENWFDGKITIFEKNNRLWSKVLISGGGRCNITTWITNKKEFISKYPRWQKFVKYYYGKFWPTKVYERFQKQWIELKIEKDMRVFPKSNSSNDVLNIFYKIFEKNNVDIKYQTVVNNITKTWNIFKVYTQNKIFEFDKIIISTWWNAYSHTWSSWDGYSFAKNFWHKITKLWPSLNSFKTKQDFTSISWISFQDWYFKYNWKNIYWSILFTHFWITWPATFILSSNSSFEKITEKTPLKVKFIANKNYDYIFLEKYILENIEKFPRKYIKNILYKLYPNKFVDLILSFLWIESEKRACYLSKDKRKLISNNFWNWFEIDLISRKAWDEFVTAGWIELWQVDINTLESKLISWLYFVWEILDVDWYTWGFNLRWCWASAYCLWKSKKLWE